MQLEFSWSYPSLLLPPAHLHIQLQMQIQFRYSYFRAKSKPFKLKTLNEKFLRLSLGVDCILTRSGLAWVGTGLGLAMSLWLCLYPCPVRVPLLWPRNWPTSGMPKKRKKTRVQSALQPSASPLFRPPPAVSNFYGMWLKKKFWPRASYFIIVRESVFVPGPGKVSRCLGGTTRRMRHKCHNRRGGAL